MLEYIVGFTPEYRLAETPREAFPDLARAIREEATHYKTRDLLSQMRAISRHDITAESGGTLEAAASCFKGEAFIKRGPPSG